MKASNSLLILLFTLFLFSCSEKEKEQDVNEILAANNQTEIQKLKEDLYKEQRKITADLERVNEKLASFEDANKYTLVEASPVSKSSFKHYIKVQGNVTTDENILIYPEFTGLLEAIFVKEGDEVRKGQVLARIDDAGMRNQLLELKAQRELIKTRFDRQKRLWDNNIGSEIQFLEAKTNYEQINNSVKRMEQQLAKAEIKAPFAGVIDQVITDQGQVVMQNQNPLFRIVNLSNMYVEANVPESYVGKIDQGTETEIQLSAIGVHLKTEVTRVSSYIEDSNRNFRVRVNLPDSISQLKPNLIAMLKLNDYTNTNVVKIPENILQETGAGDFFVYKLTNQEDNTATAVFQKVQPGINYQGEVEILSGLKDGDVIVTEGARTLKRDEKVRIANTK